MSESMIVIRSKAMVSSGKISGSSWRILRVVEWCSNEWSVLVIMLNSREMEVGIFILGDGIVDLIVLEIVVI